ncbi:MAG: metallophosphoesterase, partial [Cyanobacteria bacterium J06639_1]
MRARRRRQLTMLLGLLVLAGLGGGAIAGLHSARRSQLEINTTSASTDTIQATSEAQRSQTETTPPETLPPETEAIVASVGTDGLFQPTRGDVRLVVISDLNGSYGSTDYDPEVDTAIALLPFWKPDMVLASGDMVAGQNPTLTPEQIRAMWAGFDEHVAAPLRDMEIPYGFTIGN